MTEELDEIKNETDPKRKSMLLQKYGLIPPQLTKKEKMDAERSESD